MEIERKFLLPHAPDWLSGYPSEEIEQGYLTAARDETQVRLRRMDCENILGVKRGTGRVREELEVGLTDKQLAELWPLTEGRRVRKTRYRVELEGVVVEVDVFAGELDGLVTAEVEFETEQASDRFEPPDWLGPEVTGEHRLENESLAEQGLPEEAG